MSICKNRSSLLTTFIFIAGFLPFESFGALPQSFVDSTNAIIETLRKRDCFVSVAEDSHQPAGQIISIRQLNNYFGFGASIGKKWFFQYDSATYGDAFRRYFDWATPENEMKWDVNEELGDYQDYADADWLISWCDQYHIKVRGHNLFWNEKREWIPDWVMEIYAEDTAGFKATMKRRLDSTMTHFKGRVAHWDLINEIVHGESGLPERPGLLVTLSGDTSIFSWIFTKAREIDPVAKLGVNEFGIITANSSAKEYIEEIKSIESKGAQIDIVGLEGHLGDYVERTSYLERIDTIAAALPHELWLTEVDFLVDTLVRADKMEELMRTCFAHPRVGGLVLWVWWEGNRWRPYTSFLVDSNFTENDLGERWRTVRDSWKTATEGTLDAGGGFGFRGFHGDYVASVQLGDSIFCDTFTLVPGEDTQKVALDLNFLTGTRQPLLNKASKASFSLNGKTVNFTLPPSENCPLFLFVYTLSGKLLAKKQVTVENGSIRLKDGEPVSGCHIICLGTERRTFFSTMNVILK